MPLHHRFAFLVLVGCAPAFAACSGSTDAPVVADSSRPIVPSPTETPAVPSLPDASVGASKDAAATEKDAGKPVCNDLVNIAAEISILAVASDPPIATGGAIADGTYLAASGTLYTGPGGASGPTTKSAKMMLRFNGNVAHSLFDGLARTATFATVGNEIHSTTTCPSAGTHTVEYSTSATSLAVYVVESSGTRVLSFEKQ